MTTRTGRKKQSAADWAAASTERCGAFIVMDHDGSHLPLRRVSYVVTGPAWERRSGDYVFENRITDDPHGLGTLDVPNDALKHKDRVLVDYGDIAGQVIYSRGTCIIRQTVNGPFTRKGRRTMPANSATTRFKIGKPRKHVQTPAETRVAVPAKTVGSTLKGRATVRPRKRACAFCGTTKGVTKGPDPYAKELYDDDTPVLACDACRDRRRDDV